MRTGAAAGKLKHFPGLQEVKNRNNLRAIKNQSSAEATQIEPEQSQEARAEDVGYVLYEVLCILWSLVSLRTPAHLQLI